MSTGRGNNPPPASYAAPEHVQASASQTLLDQRNTHLLNALDSGTDVRNIKELNPYLNLFDSSVANNQNYSGQGLLSQNELSGGNSRQLGLIAQQIQARQKQQAQGDLYNAVQGAHQAAESGLQWGAGMDQNRNMGNAQMQNQRYTTIWSRPQQPSIWSQILGGAARVATAF